MLDDPNCIRFPKWGGMLWLHNACSTPILFRLCCHSYTRSLQITSSGSWHCTHTLHKPFWERLTDTPNQPPLKDVRFANPNCYQVLRILDLPYMRSDMLPQAILLTTCLSMNMEWRKIQTAD